MCVETLMGHGIFKLRDWPHFTVSMQAVRNVRWEVKCGVFVCTDQRKLWPQGLVSLLVLYKKKMTHVQHNMFLFDFDGSRIISLPPSSIIDPSFNISLASFLPVAQHTEQHVFC